MSGSLTPSGGTPDKGLKGSGRPRAAKLDFLTSGLRLKDLDQPSLSVLTACGEEEEMSVESSRVNNGLFASALKVSSRKAPGRSTCTGQGLLQGPNPGDPRPDQNDDRRREKKELFPPFEPHLFTTDARPVYLKPGPLTRSRHHTVQELDPGNRRIIRFPAISCHPWDIWRIADGLDRFCVFADRTQSP